MVILADLHKRFNADDFHRPVLVHPQLGLGTERVDRQRRIRYDTVTKSAVAAALTRESKAEEMRILYVALTRAKEKLICVDWHVPRPETGGGPGSAGGDARAAGGGGRGKMSRGLAAAAAAVRPGGGAHPPLGGDGAPDP